MLLPTGEDEWEDQPPPQQHYGPPHPARYSARKLGRTKTGWEVWMDKDEDMGTGKCPLVFHLKIEWGDGEY